jgi:hypothetical protein
MPEAAPVVRKRSVNLKKIAKRLRREASANPKKAVVLALLLLVALYRWAPLVATWLSDDEPQADRTAQTGSAHVPPADKEMLEREGPGDAASKREEPPRWDQVVRWREQDPRTVASALMAKRRDPFRLEFEAAESESEREKEPQPVVAAATPRDLGLGLSATVVGVSRRVAMIDGKAYTEGKTIARMKDGQRFEFALVRILPRHVVLGQGDRRFVLAIPRGTSSGTIERASGLD